jgi:hypothetical protein
MTPAYFFLKWIVAQLDKAYPRLQWKYEIAKAEAWKSECQRRFNALSTEQKRSAEAEAYWRRLFGGHGRHRGVRVQNEDKHDGPPGYRVCSSASWDNAVRAFEEDR